MKNEDVYVLSVRGGENSKFDLKGLRVIEILLLFEIISPENF